MIDVPTLPVFDRSFKANPFALYDLLRDAGGLTRIRLPSGVPCWLSTGYELGRQLLTHDALSKDSHYAGPDWHQSHINRRGAQSAPVFRHLLTTDPPDHGRLRRLVSREFHPTYVTELRPAVERVVKDTLDAIDPTSTMDFVDAVATAVPLKVICEVLGAPYSDRSLFSHWSRLLTAADADEQHLITGAGAELRQYLLDLAGTLRSEGRDCLFGRLATTRDSAGMTSDELVAMGFILLVAGHETTAGLLATGLLTLHRQDGAWHHLLTQPEDVPALIEELLRLCSPIDVATPRFARRTIDVGGQTIDVGDTVFVGLAAANRDPLIFPGPDAVSTARDRPHLAFGHGTHFCLGAGLARVEAEICFRSLAARFPDLEVDHRDEVLTWVPGLLLRGLRRLPVRLQPGPSHEA